jgi:uncharacterized protein YxjI
MSHLQKLIIEETIGGDSFKVKTKDNRPLLTIEAKALSLSGCQRVFDDENRHIFSIRHDRFAFLPTLRTKFYCENIEGKSILEIRRKFNPCKFVGRSF